MLYFRSAIFSYNSASWDSSYCIFSILRRDFPPQFNEAGGGERGRGEEIKPRLGIKYDLPEIRCRGDGKVSGSEDAAWPGT